MRYWKRDRLAPRRWFAWYPVATETRQSSVDGATVHRYVWLESVIREGRMYEGGIVPGVSWSYTEIDPPGKAYGEARRALDRVMAVHERAVKP